METEKKVNVHIYHHNDLDGFASAACIASAYAEDTVEFQIANHGVPMNLYEIDNESTSIVYILDYSISNEVELADLDRFISTNKHIDVVIIDHHESSKASMLSDKYPHIKRTIMEKGIFSTDVSAAGLCWAYIFYNKNIHNFREEALHHTYYDLIERCAP